MHQQQLSCDVTPPAAEAQPKSELEITAAKMGITPAKLKSMREYATFLRRSDRRMKESTIRRKICEKYKIKLV